jgi:hypothetical protein
MQSDRSLWDTKAPRRRKGQQEGTINLKVRDFFYLMLLTAASLVVHGYHPGVEDSEVYISGIKSILNPSLYPFGREFFASQAGMTLLPNLIAASVRFSHLPFDWVIFFWHTLSIFLLLLAGLQLSRILFKEERAHWAGVTLLAALLTLSVAGTALYIVDQYLNPRAFALFAAIFATTAVLKKKYLQAGLWIAFAATVHMLMVAFAISWLFFLVLVKSYLSRPIPAMSLLPLGLSFKYPSAAYREAVQTRSYFFLLQWQWYEWLGIFGPLAILYGLSRHARKQGLTNVETVCRASIPFVLFYFVVAVIFTIPDRLVAFARFQPLRSLHIVYVLLVLIGGGYLGKWLLKGRAWLWLAFCLPLSAGMFYASRQTFPATPQIEWPGIKLENDWMKTFAWIKVNTPTDAIFALNPEHMKLPGEDYQGFRALAERSMVADALKDSGVVTYFPNTQIAEHWQEQVNAQQGWSKFQLADFERLRARYGVSWVVLDQKGDLGLDCPYANATLRVCRLP